MANENLEQIKGIVKTITFHNEENGYTVAKVESEGRKGRLRLPGMSSCLQRVRQSFLTVTG